MTPDAPSRASEEFRAAAREPFEPERFERVPESTDVRREARGAVQRASSPAARKPKTTPPEVTAELGAEAGAAHAEKLAVRLADAARAFEAERYGDARRIVAALADRAPGSAAVRELYGLVLYRMGRWAEAIRELEQFRSLSGSTEQHPVLADCHRALKHYNEVEVLWEDLRQASPSAELVAEGRIVFAGALADQGELARAIGVVEPSVRRIRAPKEHQLRLLYVLGDLYERAGDIPRARVLFDKVLAADAEFADTRLRRRAL